MWPQPAMADHAQDDDWMMDLEWAGATFQLQLPCVAAEQVAAPLLPGAALPELPHELALAVLEAGLADGVRALKSLGRGGPKLLHMQQGAAARPTCPHTLSLRLHTSDGAAAIAATLHADSLGLMLLAGLVGKRMPAPPILGGELPLRLHAEIGYTYLPTDELKMLSPGDVVLMEGCYLSADRTLWLSADGLAGLQVRLPEPAASVPVPVRPPVALTRTDSALDSGAESHSPAELDSHSESDSELDSAGESSHVSPPSPTLTVLQAWNSTMSAETPPDHPAVSIERVPLRVSFDLGDVTLTVAEALALQPGQVLALARPLTGAVRIRANGAQVGEGDLVEVDGQLGVAIRTLFAAADQDAE